MRLIDTSTYELVEYNFPSVPYYAILSHTWGEDEYLFSDCNNEQRKNFAGFKKISSCCALAASEGWKYLWVDTCCIDKSSSAELSESINSMFRWYASSKICYVYLADFSLEAALEREGPGFRQSRWFTRGWTLQELLAPNDVVFYDSSWNEIGSKFFLEKEISKACRISPKHLRCTDSASVATKMSWASTRRTSREEDMAYSLLGLFGINMLLLYGEGSEAFLRLQCEIMKISTDESIFAWRDKRMTESGLLARHVSAFQHSSDIIPTGISIRPPYSMTYKGLMIEVKVPREPAIPKGYGSFLETVTTLSCARESDPMRILMLHLTISGDCYAWRRTCGRFDFKPIEFEHQNPRFEPMTVFIANFWQVNEDTLKGLGELPPPARVKLTPTAAKIANLDVDHSFPSHVITFLEDGLITHGNLGSEAPYLALQFSTIHRYRFFLLLEEMLETWNMNFSKLCGSWQVASEETLMDDNGDVHSLFSKDLRRLELLDNLSTPLGNGQYLWLKTRREPFGQGLRQVLEIDVDTIDRSKILKLKSEDSIAS